jgi:ADP-ribose pyrophosphatase YjhB (NUDIX family)
MGAARRPGDAWLARLRARLDAPPLRPRAPLWWGEARIGSVEPAVAQALAARGFLRRGDSAGAPGWSIVDPSTPRMAAVAAALRDGGFVRAWRDEQLPVADDQGRVLGSVERGVVRHLGIATHAVHLLGFSVDGRHWLQQRALNKADDPGLWDTLVGGMVPHGEPAELALARETGEEAGLALQQLSGLRYGGQLVTRRPSASVPEGYTVERLDWYRCVVPDAVAPENRDGEVAQFRLMDADEVLQRLERDEFTLDAAAMLLEAGV